MDDPLTPPPNRDAVRNLELVMALSFLVVALMALVALWMYWIAPALLT